MDLNETLNIYATDDEDLLDETDDEDLLDETNIEEENFYYEVYKTPLTVHQDPKTQFKHLVASLDPSKPAHENECIMESITQVWLICKDNNISVKNTIKDSMLFLVLAMVLEENKQCFEISFPLWVADFMDCAVNYCGDAGIIDHKVATKILNALYEYVLYESNTLRVLDELHEHWNFFYSLHQFIEFLEVGQVMLPIMDNIYNMFKILIDQKRAILTLCNLATNHDAWQFKILNDVEFVNSLLYINSNEKWDLLSIVAHHPDAKVLFPSEVLVAAMHSLDVRCTDICVLLCDNNELHNFNLPDGWFEVMTKRLHQFLEPTKDKKRSTISLLGLIVSIAKLSTLDTKKEILGAHFVSLLMQLLFRIDTYADLKYFRQETTRALWNFSFVESNQLLIVQYNRLKRLRQLSAQTKDSILQKNVAEIVKNILPNVAAVQKKWNIVISHNNEPTSKRIFQSLSDLGYLSSFDIDSNAVAMANASASALVLLCISSACNNSRAFRTEAEQCQQHRTPFIPLLVEKNLSLNQWLREILDNKALLNFCDETDWDWKIENLENEIESITSRAAWYSSPSELHAAAKTCDKFITQPANPRDLKLVADLYKRCPVSGYDIKNVTVIHSRNLTIMFEGRIELLEARHIQTAFKSHWEEDSKSPEETKQRQKTMDMFNLLAQPYHSSSSPHVSFIPCWHGTNKAVLHSLFSTGFANLATTDAGFFGKGLYNTPDAEYAHRVYSSGALLVNWVAVSSPYPVIAQDEENLSEKGNFGNYDAHFIPVFSPMHPKGASYHACTPDQVPQYCELVVFESSQVLPRYIVELQPSLPIAPPLYVPANSTSKYEDLTKETIISWSVAEVDSWFASLALAVNYSATLEEHNINGEVLLSLTKADLADIGITKFGDVRIIMLQIEKLKR